MASAKAMARIDWTRILVDASGLRPTASEARMPMMPTAMAAPNAASPTCKFPLMTEFPFSLNCSCVRGVVPFRFVPANQQREDVGQQHEDEGLNHADQQLKEIEGNGQQPAEAGD